MKLRPSINNDMIENKKLNINFYSMNATVVEFIINIPDLCRLKFAFINKFIN